MKANRNSMRRVCVLLAVGLLLLSVLSVSMTASAGIFSNLRDKVQNTVNNVKDKVNSWGSSSSSSSSDGSSIGSRIKNTWNNAKNRWSSSSSTDSSRSTGSRIRNTWNKMKSGVQNIVHNTKKAWNNFKSNRNSNYRTGFTNRLSNFKQKLTSKLSTTKTNLKDTLSNIKTNWQNSKSEFGSSIRDKLSNMKDRLAPLSGKRLEPFNGNVKETVTNFVGKKIDNLKQNKEKIKDLFNNVKIDTETDVSTPTSDGCMATGNMDECNPPLLPSKILAACKDDDNDDGHILPSKILRACKDDDDSDDDGHILPSKILRVCKDDSGETSDDGHILPSKILRVCSDDDNEVSDDEHILPSKILRVCKDEDGDCEEEKPSILGGGKLCATFRHGCGDQATHLGAGICDITSNGGALCDVTTDSSKMLCTIGGPYCPDEPTLRGTCNAVPSICPGTCPPNDPSPTNDYSSECYNRPDGPYYRRADNIEANHKPVANFEYYPKNPKTNGTVLFDATLSHDTDPGDGIAAYAWDLNADGELDSEKAQPEFKYTVPGIYPVTLVVSDSYGEYDSITKNITVSDSGGGQGDELFIWHLPNITENNPFKVIVTDAYETLPGAEVEFNGSVKTTNETGEVIFTAPIVDEETTFTIQASYEDLSNSTTIQVKNRELLIFTYNNTGELANETVENTQFIVGVADGQKWIKDATVEFNDENKTTNKDGYVMFTAPDVDENTSLPITVSKDGYGSNSTSIQVIDDPNYVPEIPRIYVVDEEGFTEDVQEETMFSVIVADESGNYGVPDAQVSFDGDVKYTNETGEVNFTAPAVDQDEEYTISVSRTGYQDNHTSITVIDSSNQPKEEMRLYIFGQNGQTNSVQENSLFYVVVAEEINSYMYGIPDAQVSFDGDVKYTNETGEVNFTAPAVDQNNEYQISVSKNGYYDNTTTLQVIDEESPSPGEEIHLIVANSTFNETNSIKENETFYVGVANESNYGIPGLTVTITPVTNDSLNVQTQTLEEDGWTVFTAPMVDEEELFNISTTYAGVNDYKYITVTDQDASVASAGSESGGIVQLNETMWFAILGAIIAAIVVIIIFFIWKRRAQANPAMATFTEMPLLPQGQQEEVKTTQPSEQEQENDIEIIKANNKPKTIIMEKQDQSSFKPTEDKTEKTDSNQCSTTDYMDKRIDAIINKRKKEDTE